MSLGDLRYSVCSSEKGGREGGRQRERERERERVAILAQATSGSSPAPASRGQLNPVEAERERGKERQGGLRSDRTALPFAPAAIVHTYLHAALRLRPNEVREGDIVKYGAQGEPLLAELPHYQRREGDTVHSYLPDIGDPTRDLPGGKGDLRRLSRQGHQQLSVRDLAGRWRAR